MRRCVDVSIGTREVVNAFEGIIEKSLNELVDIVQQVNVPQGRLGFDCLHPESLKNNYASHVPRSISSEGLT